MARSPVHTRVVAHSTRVVDPSLAHLRRDLRAIALLMRDGRWHSSAEIDAVGGGGDTGLRRWRDLRRGTVWRKRYDGFRDGQQRWSYRLIALRPDEMPYEP